VDEDVDNRCDEAEEETLVPFVVGDEDNDPGDACVNERENIEGEGSKGGSDISVRSAWVHLSLNSALTSVSAESQAWEGFGWVAVVGDE
jgi:hypothetical protein